MKYKFNDLIDINKVSQLIDEFNRLTEIPLAIIDNEGNMICSSGVQEICLKFHRSSLSNKALCLKSHKISLELLKDKKQIQYKCPYGLVKTLTPIVIEGKHVATLFIGQFVHEKPDIEYFKNQAIDLGYDVEEYLKSLAKIPIISKEKSEYSRKFLIRLAELISDMALTQLNIKKTEELVVEQNLNLENLVKKRTEELLQLNCKLEKEISVIKNTEHKLKESEERYKNLLSMLPYGILVRENSKILFINKYATELLGLDNPAKVVGKRIDELFYPHPGHKKQFYKNLKIIEEKGGMALSEETLVRKTDNRTVHVETVVTTIPYNDTKASLVVFRNISERKRLENLKNKIQENSLRLKQTLEYDRLRTEFFSNISHELKTPINVVFSAIQTLYLMNNEKELDHKDKIDNYLGIMKQNCLRLIRLVNNLLDITKIDAGYLEIELVNCDIISTVENIVLSVAEYIKDNGVELVFDTEIEEKIMACDRDKIERIILNLLSNATKFTKPGGKIVVYIKEKNNNIIISVKDTGIGIPIEKQKMVFERFVQVDKSLSRKREGSGIGLSLVKSLVEMHKGKIYVNSEYTEGSEFIVELPITVVSNNPSDEQNNYIAESETDKIHVEFSDIYM